MAKRNLLHVTFKLDSIFNAEYHNVIDTRSGHIGTRIKKIPKKYHEETVRKYISGFWANMETNIKW